MCHCVMTSGERYFLTLNASKRLVIGTKRFGVRYGKLHPIYYGAMPFRLERIHDGYRMGGEDLVREQSVTLNLSTLTASLTAHIELKCGAHVASFHRGFSNRPYIVAYDEAELIAAFYLDDITFFDGQSVSVKSILLPDPSEFPDFEHIRLIEESWEILKRIMEKGD